MRQLDYSPNEKYLLTFSSKEPTNPRDSASVTFNIFDTRTARKLRVFEGPTDEFAVGTSATGSGGLQWPVFKWAGGKEDSYFARLTKNAISVYQAPEMGLLDKRSVKLEAVQVRERGRQALFQLVMEGFSSMQNPTASSQ